MSKKKTPRVVRKHLRRIAALGGKAGSTEAKAAAGKAGMAKRWANILRCPACHRPATPAQRAEMEATQHGSQETKVV